MDKADAFRPDARHLPKQRVHTKTKVIVTFWPAQNPASARASFFHPSIPYEAAIHSAGRRSALKSLI
jgi:hypothetical protein